MLEVQAKKNAHRAKLGVKPWVVDLRSEVHVGGRKFFATKAEAMRFIEKLNETVSPEARSNDSYTWTFKNLRDAYIEWLDEELESNEVSISYHTEKERHTRQFLECSVGIEKVADMLVRDMTYGMIQIDIMKELAKTRSKKTVENILGSVSVMMRFSQLKGCRKDNPVDGVKRKGKEAKAEAPKAERIAPHVIDNILDHMEPHWYIEARFACTTGLRQGEQRALTWGCLDLDNCKVRVTRAIKHRAAVGAPKSKSGTRTIDLPRDVVAMLKELYISKGRPNNPDELVFCTSTKNEKMPSKYIKAIDRACKRAGEKRITWHDLRHFYASTLLYIYPNDLWRVRSYMGHRTIAITQERYGHWLDEKAEDTQAVDSLTAGFARRSKPVLVKESSV